MSFYEMERELSCKQMEIESLRQQLAAALNKLEMAEACLAGDNALIAGLKNDLAAAIAACELKDESLEAAHNGLRWWMDAFPLHVTEADNEEMLKIVKALAIQPDDSALKAWLGGPEWFYRKNENGQPSAWVRLHVELKLGELLYKPKGLVEK